MTLSFHPLAERELNDAAHYYDRQNPGLGDAFVDEVERSCADIASFPEAGQSSKVQSAVDSCGGFRTHCSTPCTRTASESLP
jgi:plasmid stabilization system protein ParE